MMRKTIYVFMIAALALTGCNEEEEVSTDLLNFPATAAEGGENTDQDLPSITFEEDTFDFGKIAEGQVVNYTFTFENSGKAPLLISDVKTTCGCTVPKTWPKEPIQPGEGGVIEVSFDSARRNGFQKKKITVMSNTVPSKNYIYLTGEVAGPDTQSQE